MFSTMMIWREQPNRANHTYVAQLKDNVAPEQVIRTFDQLMTAGPVEP